MEDTIKTSEAERLQLFGENYRESLVNNRPGEFRFGEKVKLPNESLSVEENLRQSNCDVVLLGINEDIGVRANLGRPGAATAWEQCIPHLFNLQDNKYLQAEKVLLLGQVNFSDLDSLSRQLNPGFPDELKQLREMVAYIDQVVYTQAKRIFDSGKKLIVIGGGHNNSYPLIKALHDSCGHKVSILNFDPHADLRDTEGRHSGNGFTYALKDDLLREYHIFGLGESVNNTQILDRISKNEILSATTMESILDEGPHKITEMLDTTLSGFSNECVGLEVDMDVLTHYPASALNSSGFSGNELRSLIRNVFKYTTPKYVHICEAAPDLASSQSERSQAANFLAKVTSDVCKKMINI